MKYAQSSTGRIRRIDQNRNSGTISQAQRGNKSKDRSKTGYFATGRTSVNTVIAKIDIIVLPDHGA